MSSLLQLVYDGTSNHLYVAVLDGQHLENGPLATVHFEHAIPATLHGGFAAGGLAKPALRARGLPRHTALFPTLAKPGPAAPFSKDPAR